MAERVGALEYDFVEIHSSIVFNLFLSEGTHWGETLLGLCSGSVAVQASDCWCSASAVAHAYLSTWLIHAFIGIVRAGLHGCVPHRIIAIIGGD